ncbi:MAG: LPS-assembly protein LptD, partial [Acidobacteriaceae bacterium]|nr:LPS-assembly protein LptD [Acidobacteriaceae bacterium]
SVETSDFDLSADQIDYNSDTHWAYARGHVHLEHFVTGDKLDADHAEYNLKTEDGKFYAVDGTSPAKILTSPGILTTTSPFYFQAQWAERIKDRYILHQGFVTDCKLPKPWWTFEAPVFDIIPGDRAISRHTIFRLRHIPIFYLPIFYRPLGKNPRQSGFLTPNIGHSSLYGFIAGAGYYWAINRSYDTTAIGQYYSDRGPALRYNLRGKPNDVTDFNFNLYGVHDSGITLGNTLYKEGGTEFELTAKTEIWGFRGMLDYNYLTSYVYREAFSYAFTSPIWSQNNSLGFLQRHFKDDVYTFNVAMDRQQNFEAITYPYQKNLTTGAITTQQANEVIIQRLPSLEFSGRDQQITDGSLPIWFSFGSSASLLNRSEPTAETSGSPGQIFQTGNTARIDIAPHVMTEFNFKGFSLIPAITLGATDYSSSYSTNNTVFAAGGSCGDPTCPVTTEALGRGNVFRRDADFTLDLRLPALERVYNPPKWLHLGGKIKHVIEAEATYEFLTGINNFQRIIHFDATDILSNTNQITYSIVNRLYKKDKNGNVSEVVSWRLAQARYFDPTFGGAVTPNQGSCAYNSAGIALVNPTCQRVVVLATEELTPYTFLDGPRSISPIVSSLVVNPYPFFGFEYRADYDPLRHKIIDHVFSGTARHGKYAGSVSETAVTTNPILIPQQNQISFSGAYGSSNRRGWNVAGGMFFDALAGKRLFDYAQMSYNTDCCGFSFELRNFNLGIRQDNQYLFSFSVANIGTFGSLQKQARIF